VRSDLGNLLKALGRLEEAKVSHNAFDIKVCEMWCMGKIKAVQRSALSSLKLTRHFLFFNFLRATIFSSLGLLTVRYAFLCFSNLADGAHVVYQTTFEAGEI